jgi:hypothetical protein
VEDISERLGDGVKASAGQRRPGQGDVQASALDDLGQACLVEAGQPLLIGGLHLGLELIGGRPEAAALLQGQAGQAPQ